MTFYVNGVLGRKGVVAAHLVTIYWKACTGKGFGCGLIRYIGIPTSAPGKNPPKMYVWFVS